MLRADSSVRVRVRRAVGRRTQPAGERGVRRRGGRAGADGLLPARHRAPPHADRARSRLRLHPRHRAPRLRVSTISAIVGPLPAPHSLYLRYRRPRLRVNTSPLPRRPRRLAPR
jgi:hypothetical protein